MWNSSSWIDGRRYLKQKALKCCLLIGNSRWHWALKNDERWHFFHTDPDLKELEFIESPLFSWAAVGKIPTTTLLDPICRMSIKDIPLIGLPSWLGIDRALGAWGAFKRAQKFKSKTNNNGLLIADAGTVLSLTRIKANGEFGGGQLIAGMRLQLQAMSEGTKQLKNPGLSPLSQEVFPYATDEAMIRGSFQALLGALVEAEREAKTSLWLCGGDGPIFLENLIKRKIQVFHHPNLVMEGMVDIQNILNQNQDQLKSDLP